MTLTAPSPAPAAWQALRRGLDFTTAEPVRRVLPARRGGIVLLGAVLLGCAGLGLLALADSGVAPTIASPEASVPPGPAVAVPRPAAPAWVEVVRPFVAYDVAGGPFARLPLRYAARRSAAGDVREDTLTYGDARAGAAFLRLAFTRQGPDPQAAPSLFVDAARLAGAAGLAVIRSGLGFRLDTRFGPFEVAGVTLTDAVATGVMPTGEARPNTCLALRLDAPATMSVLHLVGLACGGGATPLTPEALACTIDKLDLVSAGDDEALRSVFVAAERRRGDACAVVRPTDLRLAPTDARQRAGVLLKSTL